MIQPTSLKQRFTIFMLLPIGILLLAIGFAGFILARNHLLTQWGEATILRLQRAAHHVDMRLSMPKKMLEMFHNSAGMPHSRHVQGLILDQIKELEWVTRVDLTWVKKKDNQSEHLAIYHHIHKNKRPDGVEITEEIMMMPFHRGSIVDITPPHFDSSSGSETVSLLSYLKDENDQTIGQLNVEILFDYLVDTVEATGWWQDHKAFLVDDTGGILTSNMTTNRKKLAENNDPLERSTLYTMKSLPFGTIFGQGFPPEEVSGFYKLKEAPWTLVIVVPGNEILSSIIHFSLYYFAIGGISILIILFLIRFITERAVSSIKDVSAAAHKVAEGDYDVSLPVKTQDEVGELTSSFNTMVHQLEERAHLKYSLNLAREVQQTLLPRTSETINCLDIAGQSIYCDETGGDYYDFLSFPELGQDRVGIAVGDVADHGVASALFMTTARALIRSRTIQPGNLGQMITDVNRLLCIDTEQTGNFMTLFYMLLDVDNKDIRWVRAGHDPAILYDTAKDEFFELGGKGIALGVDENWCFKEYTRSGWSYGQLVLIGTDGIWETVNRHGEKFGKDRLRQILRRNSHVAAEKILQAVTDAITRFRQEAPQIDDITLVIIKATS